MSRIRVLLVDDSDDFLLSASSLIAVHSGLELAGTAKSGAEALDQVERLRPDLLLVDVSMPDLSGFEIARRISAFPRRPVVVLLTFHESNVAQQEARAAGADALLSKTEIMDRLTPLVHELIPGEKPRPSSDSVSTDRKGGISRPRDPPREVPD